MLIIVVDFNQLNAPNILNKNVTVLVKFILCMLIKLLYIINLYINTL